MLMTAATLIGCAEPPEEACPASSDFVAVTSSGTPPLDLRRTARFSEVWRRGGTNEGEEVAEPIAAAVSREGRVAIADFTLAEVILISADGEWLGPIARRGSGPGELQSALAVAWDDAERLVVFDVLNAKVLRYSATDGRTEDLPLHGSFAAAVMASGGLVWAGVAADGTAYAQPMGQIYGDTGEAEVVVLRGAPGASTHDTVARARVPHVMQPGYAEYALPGAPQLRAAVRSDGNFAIMDGSGGYTIRIFATDGSPAVMVCRDARPLPLTAHERGVFHDSLAQNSFARDRARAISTAAAVARPAHAGRIFFDADRRLWVQRERPDPLAPDDAIRGVPGAHYDLFSHQGRYLGELRAPERLRVQNALGSIVYGFETTEDGAIWLVAYEVAALGAAR